MSSWLAAPLAAVLMIALSVGVGILVFLGVWVVGRIEDWIGENRFNAIGGVFSLCLVLIVACVFWFLLFAWLKGWA